MRKVIYIGMIVALCWFAEDCARAAELHVPQNAVAGQPLSIGTSGSGTLYLVGPGQVIKKEFKSGSVEIKGEELRSAGRWIAVVRGDSKQSQVFWVKPGKPGKLNFLARPSRVPVARPNVISGVTFVFDQYQNLILDPTPVKFNLSVGGAGSTKSVTSREGVAWINSASAPKAGAAQFVASVDDTSVARVVQQVAADPCERSFRMHVAGHTAQNTIVETDPIRDCSGNPVPDGTIVTFIQTDKTGKSTVDARIKKGTARAELPASDNATITVAAGVVLGNELHVGGR
ncbi:MAG TPA: hypothetical protein VLA83_01000 [Candidatus Binatia bacterium]|nr:hypothetical protein [Candidatus Binatia bacterium]